MSTHNEKLLELAMQRAVTGKGDLAASLAENCLTPGVGLTETELALAYDIVRILIGSVDVEIRRHLAEYLAERDDLPDDLAVSLIHDDIAVAYPVLVHNQTLSDGMLVDVIEKRTCQHRMAISIRRAVGKQVSNALVACGDPDVVESLLYNKSAVFDADALEEVIEAYGHISALHLPLVRRRELSDEQARRLSNHVGGSLRRHLMSHFDFEAVAV